MPLEKFRTSAANLTAALQDVVPYLALTPTDATDGTGSISIQAKDAAGNNLAQRFLIHTWIADADFSEPDAQTGFAVTTGEQMYQHEALADFTVISDANGVVAMNIDTGGAKTVYVMAQANGRIYSQQVDITAA